MVFSVDSDAVQMTFVTAETETVMYQGSQFADHLMGIVAFRFPKGFLETATIDQVTPKVDAVFSHAATASAGPATIALGQTQDDVKTALGLPEKVVNLGPKTIWAYKDMKVIFISGKVSDVQ